MRPLATQACAATASWSWARKLLRSMSINVTDGVTLNASHYLEALRACTVVVGKPGSGRTRSAANFALELLQDFREAGWLEGEYGEDAYLCAMEACVPAEDAWSALALLESAEDDKLWRSVALRTVAMQVKRPRLNGLARHTCICVERYIFAEKL